MSVFDRIDYLNARPRPDPRTLLTKASVVADWISQGLSGAEAEQAFESAPVEDLQLSAVAFLAKHYRPTPVQIMAEAARVVARKKPGPKPKVKP